MKITNQENIKIEVNKAYQVTGFSDQCPMNYIHRLLAFGFIPGAKFNVLRIAPLGNPYEIEIQGVKVSLRKSELDLIQVKAV
ncbi:FeoA domain-containing protein [Thiotrichales bacterium 19X7-9]|nr:FeoA domain-containing protein [Thiotrichales bacterium 19X7-9]TNF70058.1 MAG: ferrous iron transporter A [Gammaproteobacteria bacterium]UTW41900.1 FeoA domain-containing protein [bacterium SCSIO 12844]